MAPQRTLLLDQPAGEAAYHRLGPSTVANRAAVRSALRLWVARMVVTSSFTVLPPDGDAAEPSDVIIDNDITLSWYVNVDHTNMLSSLHER